MAEPLHDELATGIAPGTFTLVAGDIAGIDELEAGFSADVIGAFNGGYRCGRQVS